MLTHIAYQPETWLSRPGTGLSAKHLEDNRSRKGIQKKNTQPTVPADGVVQRAIVAHVFDDTNLSQEDTAKLQAVKQYMDNSLQHVNSSIVNLFINITHMPGKNPASTKLNDPKTGIVVTVGSWFIRISSVGDICGMIAHEIGVHTLGTNQMPEGQLHDEKHFQKKPFTVKVGLHHHTVTPWDNDTTIRQRDHINVVRDTGSPGPPVRGVFSIPQHSNVGKKVYWGRKKKSNKQDQKSPQNAPLPPKLINSVNARMEQYTATMLRLGDVIEADGHITPQERDKRLHDLLSSFLFDYARILVTDDTQWRVIDKTPLVAQAYNWYKTVIIARHGNAHQWLRRKSMQPTSSTWGLRAYLLMKLTHALSVQLKDSQTLQQVGQTGVNMLSKVGTQIVSRLPERVKPVARGVGGLVSNIGSGLWSGAKGLTGWGLGVTGKALKGVGSGLSYVTPGIVKSGLRGLDHVYGEVENLIVPNVVTPVVKGVGKGVKTIGKGAKALFEMMDTG